MRIFFFITLCLYVCSGLLVSTSSSLAEVKEKTKYIINPTEDIKSPKGIYIPENLEDSFKELDSMLSPDLIDELKNCTKKQMIRHHFGLGRWMRNNWGLWSKSRLTRYFNNLGVYHADDMSGIILNSYKRYLNKQPIQLDEQIEYYKRFWEKVKKIEELQKKRINSKTR